ncbi:MAG: glucose 1-dehydrogenase [Desulfosarcinaceae bacterium]
MDIGRVLQGQTVVVTGANSGIGEGIALAMGYAGANVTVNYVTQPEKAKQVAAKIEQSGSGAIAVKADVSNENEVIAMFRKTIETFGTVDILVSNAGIQKDSAFVDMTMDKWNAVIGVNLTGAFLCAREAVREFLNRGVIEQRSKSAGKIIFTSSVHEVIPWSGHANYATSKGGIMMLMKSIAQELAGYKIRVNSIGPGAIKTNINKNAWNTAKEEAELLKLIPYNRVGVPQDIGPVAVWLASDEADYITGTTIYVDGGMLLYPGFRTGG